MVLWCDHEGTEEDPFAEEQARQDARHMELMAVRLAYRLAAEGVFLMTPAKRLVPRLTTDAWGLPLVFASNMAKTLNCDR